MPNQLYTVDNGYGFSTSNGNITASNVLTITANSVALGSNANVLITGGSNGQVLTTNGNGNLRWTTVGGGGSSNSISTTSATGNIIATTYSSSDPVSGKDFLGFTSYSYVGANYIMNQVTAIVEYNAADGSNIMASTELNGGRILITTDPTYGSGNIELNSQNILIGTGGGNVIVNSVNVELGNVSNIHITGGNSGEVLSTDGSGNLSWISAGGGGTSISNGNASISTFDAAGVEIVANTFVSVSFTGDSDGSNRYANFNGTLRVINAGSTASGAVDFTEAANVSLGAVANLHITGGSNGQALTTDGSGNLSWTTISGGGSSNAIYEALNGSNGKVITSAGNIGSEDFFTTGMIFNSGGTGNTYFNIYTTLATNGISDYTTTTIRSGNINLEASPTHGGAGMIDIAGSNSINLNSPNVTLGPVANLHITGGSNGQVLTTDGAGGLSWANVGGGTATSLNTGSPGNFTIASDMFAQAAYANIGGDTLVRWATGNYGPGGSIPYRMTNISGTLNVQEVFGSTDDATGTIGAKGLAVYGFLNVADYSANAATVDFIRTSNVALGAVANLHITGGSNGQVLTTNGSGGLSWTTVSGGGSYGDSNVATLLASFGSNSISTTGNITANLVTGTLATAAQPNITSVGTLSNLTSNGNVNFTGASNVSLGDVGNVKITGGYDGYYLRTDGLGNISWSTPVINFVEKSWDNGNNRSYMYIDAYYNAGGGIYSAVTAMDHSGYQHLWANYFGYMSYGSLTTAVTFTANAINMEGGSVNANTDIYLTKANAVVNLSNAANIDLGAVANLHISGGTNGQVLTTNGSGGLSWTSAGGGGGSPAGNTTEIQFNSSGSFAASPDLTFQNIPVAGVGNILTTNIAQVSKMLIGSVGPRKASYDGASGNISIEIYNGTIGSSFFTVANPATNINMDIPTGNSSQYDMFDGQEISIRFVGNSSATYNLTWTTTGNNSWREVGVTLPTTIPQSKTMYVKSIYNQSALRWDVIDVKQQA